MTSERHIAVFVCEQCAMVHIEAHEADGTINGRVLIQPNELEFMIEQMVHVRDNVLQHRALS